MNQTPLTPKQQTIFDYIRTYIDDFHVPPSLRDIGAHLGLSVGTVQDQVEAIRRKGFLEKEKTLARSLRVAMGIGQVPILGRVHAGALHAAIENVEGYVSVGPKMAASQHFALRVKGDSMIGAGILEGDTVIVRVQATANHGDIVVARVEDEATVKYLRRRGDRTILEPANPEYSPIREPFALLGVVVEVRRHYKK